MLRVWIGGLKCLYVCVRSFFWWGKELKVRREEDRYIGQFFNFLSFGIKFLGVKNLKFEIGFLGYYDNIFVKVKRYKQVY